MTLSDRTFLFQTNSTEPRMQTQNDMPFNVMIINDDVDEGTEYFEVHFFVDNQTNSGGYAFPSSIARVTIFDDDGDDGGKCSDVTKELLHASLTWSFW